MTDRDGAANHEQTPESPKGEKVVLHVAFPLWRKPATLAFARAKELQDRGDEVVVTYCASTAGVCAANYTGSPVACWACRNRVRQTAAELGLKAIPLEPTAPAELTVSERKELAIGVQSGVTSTFRTLPKAVDPTGFVRWMKRRYLRTASRVLGKLNALVESERPDRVEVFNGRQACARIGVIAAKSAALPFNTLEVAATQQPIIFRNHTPHDRKAIQRRVLRQELDEPLADEFFARRRQGASNKFAKKHAKDFTPPSADGFRRKIGVFLSSQDEFASLGPDWVSPFLDYASVLERACRENPDCLFAIRFHPNQADIAGDIVTPFAAVAALPNTIVYYPTDDANTYTLVDWSDTVVTFGSTITIEACWAGKPVIMLGPSFFDELGVSYNPKNTAEFAALVGRELTPKDRAGAGRFARYSRLDHDPMKYVRFTGKTLVGDGVRLRLPAMSWLARKSDDLLCNVAKGWVGFWAKRAAKPTTKAVAPIEQEPRLRKAG